MDKLRTLAINVFRRLLRGDKANYPTTVEVTQANLQTVDFIRSVNAKVIAEIGIYRGDTSKEIAKYLNGDGELHLFDYTDRVDEVSAMLSHFRNVKTFGCSYKLLDSYNWQLAKLFGKSKQPIYDYIFIDGAHTFAIDALTFFLCDRLLKPGGHIDFDDYHWTLETSPSLNPRRFPLTAKLYTDEQIKSQQVAMIVDLLVRTDGRYEEAVANKVFQKNFS